MFATLFREVKTVSLFRDAQKWIGITLLGKIQPPKVRKPMRFSGFAPGEQRAHLDRLVMRRRKEMGA